MSVLLPSVARNSNRLNSQGGSPRSLITKTSIQIRQILPAGKTIQLMGAGDKFRFVFGTGKLNIRPMGDVAGSFNTYYPGTGLDLAKNPQEILTSADGKLLVKPEIINSFNGLDISNPNSTDVYFEIFMGYDDWIDQRLVFPSIQFQNVPISTFDGYTDAAGGRITVNDLSGTTIVDENGNSWFAVSRLLLIIANADSAAYCFVTNTASTVNLAIIHPLTTAQFAIGGNVKVNKGNANASINGTLTEIYQCLAIS